MTSVCLRTLQFYLITHIAKCACECEKNGREGERNGDAASDFSMLVSEWVKEGKLLMFYPWVMPYLKSVSFPRKWKHNSSTASTDCIISVSVGYCTYILQRGRYDATEVPFIASFHAHVPSLPYFSISLSEESTLFSSWASSHLLSVLLPYLIIFADNFPRTCRSRTRMLSKYIKLTHCFMSSIAFFLWTIIIFICRIT